MTQNERIIRHLEDYGSITPMEAIGEYGIMRLASRVSDLRKAGYPIHSELIKGKNRYGENTRFAKYTLRKDAANGEEILPAQDTPASLYAFPFCLPQGPLQKRDSNGVAEAELL